MLLAQFLNESASKATGVEDTDHISDFMAPVKIKGGLSECLS